MNESLGLANCDASTGEASHWMYGIQSGVSMFIILENLVMLIAIVNNWYNLTRQHNMYRYLVSLVAADLLYGIILFIHGILTFAVVVDGQSLVTNSLQDLANNIITGVLHGSCFASLASASLLNLVIRMTYTRALERAAAIEAERPRQIAFFRAPSLRCPKTTRVLIGFIWALTLTFIITPLKIHCHEHMTRCTMDGKTYIIQTGDRHTSTVMNTLRSSSVHQDDHGSIDCSFLRPPNSRSYVLVLNFCITVSWCLMLICNMMTICIKTTVKKSVRVVSGDIVLTLSHRPGITWDSSSILVAIITLSMTVSTLPYVIFSFVTEGGPLERRLAYATTLSPNIAMSLEMTTLISSLLNPFIYTAMLGKLRSDIARLLELCHKKILRTGSRCLGCNKIQDEVRLSNNREDCESHTRGDEGKETRNIVEEQKRTSLERLGAENGPKRNSRDKDKKPKCSSSFEVL